MNDHDDIVGDRSSGVDKSFAIVPEGKVVLQRISHCTNNLAV